MEHLSSRSPDEEPHGPDHDRLDPGEIDMTGATRQDDALADVIGDAISEAESGGGEVPDWGARTLARALANERDDPLSGALHHFAVTGRANPDAMARELADLYETTDNHQIKEWVNWLGTYVVRIPEDPTPTEQVGRTEEVLPTLDTRPEVSGAHLRQTFADADARGEAIAADTARDLARLLAIFLNPDSEMAHFADTGNANPVLLSQESQTVRRLIEHVPGADEWVTRFEQHLASRNDLGRQPHSATPEHQNERTLPSEVADALAHGKEGELSETDARSIARFLAGHQAATATGALNTYGNTGDAIQADMIRELFDLHVAGDDQAQQLVRALGSYLIWQVTEAEMTRDTAAADAEPRQHGMLGPANFRVLLGLEAHGHAFIGYLQLHDVDPHDDMLLHGFHDCYLGSYPTTSELVQAFRTALIDSGEVADSDPATLNDENLMHFARRAWDIVESGGKLHVFSK